MNNANSIKLNDFEIIQTIHGYQKKKKVINVVLFILYLGILGGFFAAVFFMAWSNGILAIVSTVVAIICIPVCNVLSKQVKKVEKELKLFYGENVTKSVIAERIDIEEYDPDSCFKSKFVHSSGIVPNFFDNIYGSDYIRGYYKDKKIVYSDIKLEYIKKYKDSDGRKHTTSVIVFQGPFLSLYLTKNIEGYVKICERQNPKKKKGFITELLTNALYSAGIKLGPDEIEVESVEFNNRFEITTDNKELAFYILTPNFMENIIKADELANGYTNIKFDENRAKIAINNGYDAFELSKTIFNEKRLEEARQNIRNDLNVLLAIIDEILEKERLFEAQ